MKSHEDTEKRTHELAALIAVYKKQLPDGTPEQLDELRRQMKAMDPSDVRARAMAQAMAALEL